MLLTSLLERNTLPFFMSDMSMQTSSHTTITFTLTFTTRRGSVRLKCPCVCPPEQKTRLARIHATKSGGTNAYLQYKRNGMLAEAEEEVTEETMSPGSLLMERDMMGWCMWTPLPPGRSPLCQGAGVQQGCCPHSTLPWCSSNSFSLSFALSHA